MRYISIDLETTGLDPVIDQILSMGAVIEDTSIYAPIRDLPKFHAIITRERIVGSSFAVVMNADLISRISKYISASPDEKKNISEKEKVMYLQEDELASKFNDWLWYNGISNCEVNGRLNANPCSFTVAGKNFASFDSKFLETVHSWKAYVKIKHRIIDPSVLCTDWRKDMELPNLEKCKARTSTPGKITHDALEDAIDVVEILRNFYDKKPYEQTGNVTDL